jgi:hypothetical protein
VGGGGVEGDLRRVLPGIAEEDVVEHKDYQASPGNFSRFTVYYQALLCFGHFAIYVTCCLKM